MQPRSFHLSGEALRDDPLHYTDCGLDNIYLMNGFEVEVIDGEEFFTVKDIDGLHEAIGLHIVLEKKAPTGSEMRFLRTEMGLSQADLASKLGVSDQSVARWEKGHVDVPGTAVFAFKVLYVFSLIPEDIRSEVMERFISALDELSCGDETEDSVKLAYSGERWLDAA